MITTEKETPRAVQAPGGITNASDRNTRPDVAQLRKAAAEYLARGWHPIPLQGASPGNADTGKRPMLPRWQRLRAVAANIPQWWPSGTWRNLGINLGPSRLVVLDFDDADAFAPWAAAHPEAANTYTVKRSNAPAGRVHLYYSLADGQTAPAQLTKAAMGWGDLKCAGGQVVAPPSVHYTGGRYEVVNDAGPLPWRDAYTPAPYAPGMPKRPTAATTPNAGEYRERTPGMPPSVKAQIEAGAGEGCRSDTAFSIATQLRDERHDRETVKAHVLTFAANCRPPLGEREACAAVASAFTSPAREPARDPHATAFNGRGQRPPVPAEKGPPPPTPEADWHAPLPLGGLGADVPRWPWECFPAPLRRLGEEMVRTMNAAAELAGLAMLAAASIACGKLARVQIKRGHTQFPNLYALAALQVGHGKTPVSKPIVLPLIEEQKARREVHREALRQWEARWKIAKAQAVVLERQAGKPACDAEALTAKLAALAAVEAERPPVPYVFVDNATSEAMARALAGNGGRLGVFSSDGRDVLAIARGKYTKDGDDSGIWLKGHAGDYLAFHRAALDKPSFECPEPILAAFLAVQLDALQTLGASENMRENGFLARFLYVVPPPPVSVEYPTQSISPAVLVEYEHALRDVLQMAPDIGSDGEPWPYLCELAPDAFATWKAFHDATKRDMLAAPPLLAQCLSKTPEHLARVALVFHLVECAAARRKPGQISAAEVDRAAVLVEVLKVHTARAVALMGESAERATARQLWPVLDRNRDKLAELRDGEGLGPIAAVKARDVARFGWAGMEDTEAVRAALDALELKGWLRLRHVEAPGARPHVIYELHPTAGRCTPQDPREVLI